MRTVPFRVGREAGPGAEPGLGAEPGPGPGAGQKCVLHARELRGLWCGKHPTAGRPCLKH